MKSKLVADRRGSIFNEMSRENNMHKAKYMLTGVATASLFVAAAMNSSALDVDVSGYLDMSVLSTDTDGMPSDDSAGIDTLELCFKTEVADGVGVEHH